MSNYTEIVAKYQKNLPKTAAQLEQVLDSFKILFAYHSGKIENPNVTYHDTREIFENGQVLNYTGDLRAIFETENQKKAYEFLVDKIIAKEPISIALIKEVHSILTAGTYDHRRFVENGERPGEFKKHDYVTGINETGSPADEVEDDVNYLLKVTTEFEDKDPLKVATNFHVGFEFIHPFADGNGRTGRLLLNYYLMIHDFPPIVIHEQTKQYYYAALAKYDETGELDAMYAYLKYETEQTWQKTYLPQPTNKFYERLKVAEDQLRLDQLVNPDSNLDDPHQDKKV
jgi:Fic family protein